MPILAFVFLASVTDELYKYASSWCLFFSRASIIAGHGLASSNCPHVDGLALALYQILKSLIKLTRVLQKRDNHRPAHALTTKLPFRSQIWLWNFDPGAKSPHEC
ncbi:uncharacterized protein UV8b_04490 [Ustilaginoidea virens]|uniref:Uncharacterized protein n=1 Tax=Ustilaginoidea virens TaxID=1159556 RepID=A0A8E5HSA9_USTVR|nr:uncharacterized protein UV8b_04490 [Ustilaginoidea virens]QUC20249.1 hypothetical protein UV8b_04490 [Ustilaginoidea virens]